MGKQVQNKSSGEVLPKKGANARTPYEHQCTAMHNLDLINREKNYSTLIVLPTGGGKTYTAALWLLKNAIDRKKKILWIAHRQMLLDQAAQSFQQYAYAETMPHISSFHYRIISGATEHDRAIDITPEDDLLIVGKDSIGRNLSCLDAWLKRQNEVYLVIDEAHHATAKTYRRVIAYVQKHVPNVKLIGLTATPFRTAEAEQGLLAKIFQDGVQNEEVKRGQLGITYQIGLKDLINRQILSKPIFESYYTEEHYGESLGLAAWESIRHLDTLPDDIAQQMAKNAVRNRLIVDTYKKKRKEYGQTIVFAVNIDHAIALNKLFADSGVRSAYIVSAIRDGITGVGISREENQRNLEAFRRGDLDVLINVNILTEGVDLPKTKTVFLARPTVSTILMTQMVGRALRGSAAGGTDTAYIVSFIDDWDEHIAWVNPESLFSGDNTFSDDPSERIQREVRLIAISKIEEFASILDQTIDTTALEKVPFQQRIPIGMYAFTYLVDNGEQESMDLSCQVMVYDSTASAYREMLEELPALFDSFGVRDQEYLTDDVLYQMEQRCRDTFFCGEMIPPYARQDIENLLRYYAQYDAAPPFYTFDDLDRNRLDVGQIAQHLWDLDLGPRKRKEYIDQLWEQSDDNLLRLFFGRKLYFIRELDIAISKLADPDLYAEEDNVRYSMRELEDMPLYEIGQIDPNYEKQLRDGAFEKAKTERGTYRCTLCGKESPNRSHFQVDHIKPRNQGGKSVPENLQILCPRCNGKKGDR